MSAGGIPRKEKYGGLFCVVQKKSKCTSLCACMCVHTHTQIMGKKHIQSSTDCNIATPSSLLAWSSGGKWSRSPFSNWEPLGCIRLQALQDSPGEMKAPRTESHHRSASQNCVLWITAAPQCCQPIYVFQPCYPECFCRQRHALYSWVMSPSLTKYVCKMYLWLVKL